VALNERGMFQCGCFFLTSILKGFVEGTREGAHFQDVSEAVNVVGP